MKKIRNAIESDLEDILRLNAAVQQETSPLDRERLRWMVGMSSYCKVVTIDEQVVAFLIAFREGAAYDSENYRWFAARYPRFLYVDRVVVDARFSGRGIGSMLYDDLFDFAAEAEIEMITCEYNIDPPNPASRAFHEKFGFRELDTQWYAGGTKQVSLQAAVLSEAMPGNGE